LFLLFFKSTLFLKLLKLLSFILLLISYLPLSETPASALEPGYPKMSTLEILHPLSWLLSTLLFIAIAAILFLPSIAIYPPIICQFVEGPLPDSKYTPYLVQKSKMGVVK